MNKRVFWLLFVLVLAFAFAIRIIPPQNHNFFFTMDQADDGVWAREFFERGQLLWYGSQTNIPGVYAGPLWYYFISVGYVIFSGDPFGALFMVILLNVVAAGFLIWFLKPEIGERKALLVGFLLQFFWWFYDTSRWAFNPFPMVALTLAAVLLLARFLTYKKKKYFLLASIPVFLNFNAEVAGSSAVYFSYILFGVWAYRMKLLKLKTALLGVFGLPAIFAAVLMFQLGKRLYLNQSLTLPGESTGYFSGISYHYLAGRFAELFSYAVIPYHTLFSLLLFAVVMFWFLKNGKSSFVKHFVFLSLGLFAVSFLMFGATRGWYDWHTIYLPPILFISFLLLLLHLPKKAGIPLLAVIMFFQLGVFKERYLQYLSAQKGPSILATQLKVLDWIYEKRENDGFNAYTYIPSHRDYPYQYLFWWFGRTKYGFVPCEYSIYPHGLKLYVPGKLYYAKPTLGCERLVFLIIEHDKDRIYFDKWYQESSNRTLLLEKIEIDGVEIEKRRYKRQEEL